MEIERKYLVSGIPDNIDSYPCRFIEQGYLNTAPVVRVRRDNDNYYLTYKGGGMMAREEYNLPLNKEAYEHLIKKADGNIITKKRYEIPDGNGYTIELDIFEGLFTGTILAEVEFPTIEAANSYTAPSWFIDDVTNDPAYHNSNIEVWNMDKETMFEYIQRLKLAVITLFKWLFCSVVCGCFIGSVGAVFHLMLGYVGSLRVEYPFLLFGLPVAGIIIVFMYNIVHEAGNRGTNLVITAIQSNDEVPGRVAPLIIVSTLLTHLCGGSAGREGAALQVGGALGNTFAKLFKFDEKDTRIMIMCGMSACFSALFGTPIASAVFSMEVISVGVMYYAALVPCVLAAFIAQGIASALGLESTHFVVDEIASFSFINGSKFIIMSVLFALASILLCVVLHGTSKLYTDYINNPYIRIIIAGALVIAMRYIFGTTDYLGAGSDIIARSFVTSCAWYVFILKMLFTAVTLGGGFKGGEIVPTLFVGATLGSFLAPIFGLPVGLCAACGMVSVFCGVTNCPLTSFILSIEMFGASTMKFTILCIALSYLLSGYYSLYNSQKIIYSKYKTEYINRRSH